VVVTEDLYVSIPGQSNLAGSALTLDRAVMNASRHAGVSFAEAWTMASSRPAALLGLPEPATVSVEFGAEGFRSIFPARARNSS
jgi:N-acetylglucosamine-6-phosphate deacetylase